MPRRPRWTPPATPFTLAHVAPLGVSPEMLRWAQASGLVTRLTHGVFIATGALATDPAGAHLQRALAHQLRNPAAIASHLTSALAWELDLDDPRAAAEGPTHFITPRAPAVRSTRGRAAITRVRDLPTHHRVAHPSGLLVTSAARAAVDVASESDLAGSLIVLDSFARLELASLVGERGLRRAHQDERILRRANAPLAEAARAARTRLSGAHLDRVVPLADARREAPSESLSYALILEAGLPLPTMQARIETDEGIAFADFLWPEHRVIGEVDGAVKYNDPAVLVLEKRRQEALERLGFLVVRWMADEPRRRPHAVVGRLSAALNRGAS